MMKSPRAILIAVLFLNAVFPICAGDLPYVEKDDFRAMMFFTEDLEFQKTFHKGGDIVLNGTTNLRVNIPFLVTISFSGPGLTPEKEADLSIDMKIVRPDGKIYFGTKDASAWHGPYSYISTSTQLADTAIKVRIEPKDPTGRYVVHAILYDKVRKVALQLDKAFEVRKEAGQARPNKPAQSTAAGTAAPVSSLSPAPNK